MNSLAMPNIAQSRRKTAAIIRIDFAHDGKSYIGIPAG
jgi:hypothetical protein